MARKPKTSGEAAENIQIKATPEPGNTPVPEEDKQPEDTQEQDSQGADAAIPETDQDKTSEQGASEEPDKTSGESLREKLEPYFKSYPSIDAFYVTSDGQPFFEKQWATEHQKSLDPQGKVETVNR